uniref:Uncharacterized protein n=1 Tax=Ditylenchus dipsaci TaxID=166011 RepID=A0A915EJD8_9BILA
MSQKKSFEEDDQVLKKVTAFWTTFRLFGRLGDKWRHASSIGEECCPFHRQLSMGTRVQLARNTSWTLATPSFSSSEKAPWSRFLGVTNTSLTIWQSRSSKTASLLSLWKDILIWQSP